MDISQCYVIFVVFNLILKGKQPVVKAEHFSGNVFHFTLELEVKRMLVLMLFSFVNLIAETSLAAHSSSLKTSQRDDFFLWDLIETWKLRESGY